MKNILRIGLILLFTHVIAMSNPVQIIIDTDMLTDCDDATALAIAHTLQDKGEAKILAIMLSAHDFGNESQGNNSNTVSAINYYYHHDIPIGAWHQLIDSGGNEEISQSFRYSNNINVRMHKTIKDNFIGKSDGKLNHERLSSLELYTQLLENARTNNEKVKIVVLGQNFNIERLLRNEIQLVKDTVEEVVISAAFGSCNMNTCISSWDNSASKGKVATDYVFNNMPREVLLTVSGGTGNYDSEYAKDSNRDDGGNIYSDFHLNSPMYYTYDSVGQTGSHYKSMTVGRPLLDQMAILSAVRGNPSNYWRVYTNGYISSSFVNSSSASWIGGTNSKNHRYFEYDASKIANLQTTIKDLMKIAPKEVESEPEFEKATLILTDTNTTVISGTSISLKWTKSNGDTKNKVVIRLDNGVFVVQEYVYGETSYTYDVPLDYSGTIDIWIYSFKNGEYIDADYVGYTVKKKLWVPIIMDDIITFIPILK